LFLKIRQKFLISCLYLINLFLRFSYVKVVSKYVYPYGTDPISHAYNPYPPNWFI